MSDTYDGPPCPTCGVATDDEGEKGQVGTFLAVCMNLECVMFGRYVEVRRTGRYRMREHRVPVRHYTIWDDLEDAYYEGALKHPRRAFYAAGIPTWKKPKDAQAELNLLNGVS